MGEKNKKIAVAGHISLDITPVFQNSGKQKLSELFQPGKLLKVGKAMMCTGGAVSNTGLGLKRLGADVVLMAKIGDDYFGNALQDMIRAHGCETCITQVPGENTSYTIVLAPRGLDRFFLHDPGCNDTFGYEDVDLQKAGEAVHFHFGYPPIMRRFYQDDGEELVRLYKKIKSMGLTTSLDLVAVDQDSEAAGMDWARILERVLPYVDFFVPSAEELCFMLDRERYREWTKRAEGRDITEVIQVKDVKPLGQMVLDMGAGAVLIKCGAPGIYYRTASGNRIEDLCRKLNLSMESWKDKEGFEPGFEPDTVVSGTGAGDTSIAAFLASVLREADLKEAVEMAAAAGACCVAAYDALSGLKYLEEMKERIRRGWRKGAYRP